MRKAKLPEPRGPAAKVLKEGNGPRKRYAFVLVRFVWQGVRFGPRCRRSGSVHVHSSRWRDPISVACKILFIDIVQALFIHTRSLCLRMPPSRCLQEKPSPCRLLTGTKRTWARFPIWNMQVYYVQLCMIMQDYWYQASQFVSVF